MPAGETVFSHGGNGSATLDEPKGGGGSSSAPPENPHAEDRAVFDALMAKNRHADGAAPKAGQDRDEGGRFKGSGGKDKAGDGGKAGETAGDGGSEDAAAPGESAPVELTAEQRAARTESRKHIVTLIKAGFDDDYIDFLRQNPEKLAAKAAQAAKSLDGGTDAAAGRTGPDADQVKPPKDEPKPDAGGKPTADQAADLNGRIKAVRDALAPVAELHGDGYADALAKAFVLSTPATPKAPEFNFKPHLDPINARVSMLGSMFEEFMIGSLRPELERDFPEVKTAEGWAELMESARDIAAGGRVSSYGALLKRAAWAAFGSEAASRAQTKASVDNANKAKGQMRTGDRAAPAAGGGGKSMDPDRMAFNMLNAGKSHDEIRATVGSR